MFNRIIEYILIFLTFFCLLMIIYPTMMNYVFKEDIKELEIIIKNKNKESVFVNCSIEDFFRIKKLELTFNCEVQNWKKYEVYTHYERCNLDKKCE